MLKLHDPVTLRVSLALHVTVVKPTEYKSPDITTLPELSSHTMVEASMTVPFVSLAVGNGDQVTLAVAVPASTVTETVLEKESKLF